MTHLHRIRNELKNELNRCLDLDQHIFPIDDAIANIIWVFYLLVFIYNLHYHMLVIIGTDVGPET